MESGIAYSPIWNCFDVHNEQTCYRFNRGTYMNIEWSKKRGDQILEWSDYRSTEPLKEEQEKTVETKAEDNH